MLGSSFGGLPYHLSSSPTSLPDSTPIPPTVTSSPSNLPSESSGSMPSPVTNSSGFTSRSLPSLVTNSPSLLVETFSPSKNQTGSLMEIPPSTGLPATFK